MSGIRLEGNTSGHVAEVDASNNLNVTLPQDLTKAGYAVLTAESDSGTITGTPTRRTINVSQGHRLSVGLDTILFDYTFNAAAQDTGTWKFAVNAAMTAAQSGGLLTLNNALTVTTLASASMSSWRYFTQVSNAALVIHGSIQVSAIPLANQVMEFGLFVPAATILDGVYFRYTNAGLLGNINYNGAEISTGTLLSNMVPNTTYQFQIVCGETNTEFWIDINDGNGLKLYTMLSTPAPIGDSFASCALPITIQQRNGLAIGAGTQMQVKMSDCNIIQRSLNLEIPFNTQQIFQKGSHQGLPGGTMGQLTNMTNSLAPGAGVAMTNTTAALGATLGGQFAALPTLAANTDGIVCGYQVPVGGVAQTPRTLIVTGIHISSMVTTALTGGPVQYFYSLAFGSTALSLATTETASFVGPTTKIPRRIPIGLETFASAAAIGVVGTSGGINILLNSPIIINPGEFIVLAAKNVGTVTTLGVITFLVTFDHYWI